MTDELAPKKGSVKSKDLKSIDSSKSQDELNTGGKPAGVQTRLIVLSKRSDFLRTFRLGRKLRPSDWVVFNVYIKSVEESPYGLRCGWTCPKAVGGAVVRNRLKRWSRQWCRENLKALAANGQLAPHIDLNLGFRAMPEGYFRKLKYSEFSETLDRSWKEILRWKK